MQRSQALLGQREHHVPGRGLAPLGAGQLHGKAAAAGQADVELPAGVVQRVLQPAGHLGGGGRPP